MIIKREGDQVVISFGTDVAPYCCRAFRLLAVEFAEGGMRASAEKWDRARGAVATAAKDFEWREGF